MKRFPEACAKSILESDGIKIRQLKYIPEGHNHFVFDALLNDGTAVIIKFTNKPAGGERRDSLFGALQSIEREAGIYKLVKNESGLPAPEIYFHNVGCEFPYIVVEKLPGVLWSEYIKKHNYSREVFLDSIEKLGADIAVAQQVEFPSYGNIWGSQRVEPEGIDNFISRFRMIMNYRFGLAEQAACFSTVQLTGVKEFFEHSFEKLESIMVNGADIPPVLVFTDMHAQNFLVDESGKPSGYFDLESAQAAHPALEIYGIKFFLLNYFDTESFEQAHECFFRGYKSEGGMFEPLNLSHNYLETILAAGRVFELAVSYHGVTDGLRDNWSRRFNKILEKIIRTGSMDYPAVGDILREKNGQPLKPE